MQKNDFWKGKKVLLTGGTGFIGKNLVNRLQELGASYFVFSSRNYDLTNARKAEEAMKTEGRNYDFIVHLAALHRAGEWTKSHTGEQIRTNGLIDLNTLEAWRKFQSEAKFIAAGTICAYPEGPIPLKEENIDNGKIYPEMFYAYGAAKRFLRTALCAYKDQFKLRGTMPVLSSMYGKYYNFNDKNAHVIPSLIKRFHKAKMDNEPKVEVWGDGTQTREFTHVEDVIEGILMAAQNYEGELVNISSGTETTIRNTAEIIKREMDYKGEIFFDKTKFAGASRRVMDISLARDSFGWTITNRLHSLEEGIRKTIIWYEEHFLKES